MKLLATYTALGALAMSLFVASTALADDDVVFYEKVCSTHWCTVGTWYKASTDHMACESYVLIGSSKPTVLMFRSVLGDGKSILPKKFFKHRMMEMVIIEHEYASRLITVRNKLGGSLIFGEADPLAIDWVRVYSVGKGKMSLHRTMVSRYKFEGYFTKSTKVRIEMFDGRNVLWFELDPVQLSDVKQHIDLHNQCVSSFYKAVGQ